MDLEIPLINIKMLGIIIVYLLKRSSKMIFRKKRSKFNYKSENDWGNGEIDRNISDSLDININHIKAEIGSDDLIVNLSESRPGRHTRFACIYIDNLISNQVLSSYSAELGKILVLGENLKIKNPREFFNLLLNQFSSFKRVSQETSLEKIIDGLLSGKLVFLIDGHNEFLSIDAYSPDGIREEE